jgi:fructosamine-3-kinase
MKLAGLELDGPTAVQGGDICRAFRAHVNGRRVFAKTLSGAPAGFFAAEAGGLSLLAVDGGPPLPAVLAAGQDGLVLDWIDTRAPEAAAAADFGRRLARMHAATLPEFGAAQDGFIGSLPLPNSSRTSWTQFYVDNRLAPYISALPATARRPVEQVCNRIDDIAGPVEPPARIHGDLWSGNLLWGADGAVWLVDAASAHGGHRETDLAMLQLFGAPQLPVILEAYQSVAPLASGWQQRVPLHQLHPLLVHAVLFGGGYVGRVVSIAEQLLAV